jgi:hypothetical protein
MRRRKFGALALAACMLPSACAVNTAGGRRGDPLTPDEELEIRSSDLTRDVRTAALKGFLGAGGVYVFGGPPVGFVGVIPVVITTGTYAGFLMQQYDTEAERKARLRSDIALANAETEAAIQTVERVIAEDERAVAAAPRATAQAPAPARPVPAPEAASEPSPAAPARAFDPALITQNTANIDIAIVGVRNRQEELTVAANVVAPDDAAVQQELSELDRRKEELGRLRGRHQSIYQPTSRG